MTFVLYPRFLRGYKLNRSQKRNYIKHIVHPKGGVPNHTNSESG